MRRMETILCPQKNRHHQCPPRSIQVRILAWLLYASLILSARDAFTKEYSVSSLSSRYLARLSLAVRINNHCWNCLKSQELRLSHGGQRASIMWLSFSQHRQTSVAS